MSEEKSVENVNKKTDVTKNDENLVEIMNKLKKQKGITKEELKVFEKEAKTSLNFLELIDKIELPKEKYVVFTDGEEQLVYENGEFYVVSTIDSTKLKKKKKRTEATNMYIEYFINYTLNRINKQKEMNQMINSIKKEYLNNKELPKKEIETKEVKGKDFDLEKIKDRDDLER